MSPRASALPPRSLANRAPRRRSLITLTPLIDVVFILLVFFMLASSFLDWRSIALNAPARSTGGTSIEGALLVELRPDGLRLAGEILSLDQLVARIGERLAQRPEQRVLLKPSAGVALQEAVSVLDRLAAAGVTDLSLIRDPAR
ncbi:MAG: ExbD/TolR family protein [Kiloniellales bacterium]